ncbi:MAG: hypothetical protein AUI36_24195 [Cyanobacteria bacterium 13_1_40CM_2_61_4]|nr:MAG: hypothetical protein AUI36_24195 [Cyanobacteria bacterium 13_1_40CM_2_61_4]
MSDAMAFRRNALQLFVLRHSFDLRPSCFFISTRAFIQRVENCFFFRSDFFPDKNQLGPISLKRFQVPAAGDEIEKLRRIGQADEAFCANHARRQAICKSLKTVARKNFIGTECERFELRLMIVFGRRHFFFASDAE